MSFLSFPKTKRQCRNNDGLYLWWRWPGGGDGCVCLALRNQNFFGNDRKGSFLGTDTRTYCTVLYSLLTISREQQGVALFDFEFLNFLGFAVLVENHAMNEGMLLYNNPTRRKHVTNVLSFKWNWWKGPHTTPALETMKKGQLQFQSFWSEESCLNYLWRKDVSDL